MSATSGLDSMDWRWSLGRVGLEVRHGDLLAGEERAWVNSEQTDFILAADGRSLSSQLRALWPQMQAELSAQSKGRVQPAGTILVTSGPQGRLVFHAGFHDPQAWYFGDESSATAYLDSIRSCLDRVLDEADRRELPDIAFPLVGAGVFGLPVQRVAEIFFDCVLHFARRSQRGLRIVLYVNKPHELPRVVLYGTRAFAARLAGGARLISGEGGHPIVQAMRPGVRAQVEVEQAERLLLAFAEIALATDLAAISDDADLTVEALLLGCNARSQGCRLTFGLVRDRLEYLSSTPLRGRSALFEDRRAFLGLRTSKAAMQRLVMDRNDFAHHRRPREMGDIVSDVGYLFGAEALGDPWPELEGRWLRKIEGEHALLHAADFHRGVLTWLMPLSRRHHSETVEA